MKRNILLLLAVLCFSALTAQKELHIHHINIGNGDATMIGIFDKPSGKYTVKMLIDGGLMKAKDRLVPYIQKMCEKDDEPTRFKYAALTHYHNDHYNGLLAYLVDRFGVEAFKQYCLAINKKDSSKELFKTDFDKLISNYKQ